MLVGRLVLFMLPFAAFLLWLWLMRRARLRDGRLDPFAERLIMTAAVGAIVGLVLSMVYVLATRPEATDGIYVPPHMKDGQVVPGGFVDPADTDLPGQPAPDDGSR